MTFGWDNLSFSHISRRLQTILENFLAVDLGTTTTRVFVPGRGIVVNEPSAVAKRITGHEILAIGRDASQMCGRTPADIQVLKPLRGGVIADFSATEEMLVYFIGKALPRRAFVRPRIVIGIPSETTQVERRAVVDAAYRAKASHVYLVEQAIVAAIGADMPITVPGGNMIVDVGGGTTDIAVISRTGVVQSRSLRMAGNQMDDAIMEYMKRKYNLAIGEPTAEKIKINIGSAYELDHPLAEEVRGRNIVKGLPESLIISDAEIRQALNESIASVISAIRSVLELTPPELSADLADRGIVLAGGGAQLRNLDCRIHQETGLPVRIADESPFSVVLGIGKLLSDSQLLQKVCSE